MLPDIEKAVQQKIFTGITNARNVKIQKTGIALTNPVVFIAIEKGTFKKVGQISYRMPIDLYIEIEFKDMSAEEARRKGALLILEGIIQLLTLQKLDLNIDPLEPSEWHHITDKDDLTESKTRFQIIFKTGYSITKTDEEAVTDLLRVGLNYYLKPGDEVVDAADVMTLSQQ